MAGVTSEEVEQAIREGVRFLKERQRTDGSWTDADAAARTGTTSLVTLALLTAGEKPDSPVIQRALEFLRQFKPDQLNSTYAISLQTMVFAAAEPGTRPAAHPCECRMARARPDQVRRPDALARILELSQPADPSRRQLQYSIRPPGVECRQRGRRDASVPRSGRSRAPISKCRRIATAAGAIRPGTGNRPPA